MSEETPEPPQWVKDLISKASSDGYSRGFENGQKMAWSQIHRAIEREGKYHL